MTAGAEGPRERLLIIDDDRGLLETMSAALGRSYEIVCFDSGSAFLRNASLCRPDLVILDVDMPERDGFSICRALRRRAAFKDVPILFVTALAGELGEPRFRAEGADAYLKKPFEVEDLRGSIRSLLDARRPSPGRDLKTS